MMPESDMSEEGGKQPQYREKTSFYQERVAADRMRAAFLNTRAITGFASLSEFINAAIEEKVAGLEQAHNDGCPWSPLGAGEIPQGKPAGLQSRRTVATAGKEALRARRRLALRDLVEGILPEIESRQSAGGGEVRAFYREDGQEALIETYGAREGVPVFRRYDAETSFGEVWIHTSSGYGWDEGDGLPGGEISAGPGRRPEADGQAAGTPAADLRGTVERARKDLERQSSQRQIEIEVFYSSDGAQALVESYHYGTEISDFIHYAYDPAAGQIAARNSSGHSWKDWQTAPFDA
ncbi:hypothetical protein ACFVTE_16470 [Arthrobacter sp. NPDC058097]|uniref:ParB family protein n=1 Tax=Arthrobacter sp. NPDC058097 TaxID=3346340 RepID=UPI0036D75FE1